MIVEDQPDFLDILEFHLEASGFLVAAVPDAEKAVELLGHFRPALVITDLMMPGPTGVDLIHYIRGTRDLTAVPVIVITAADEGMIWQSRQAGADSILCKPLDYELFLQTLGLYAA